MEMLQLRYFYESAQNESFAKTAETAAPLTCRFRIPSWCDAPRAVCNGDASKHLIVQLFRQQ